MRRVVFKIPPALREKVTDLAKRQDVSYATILIDSIGQLEQAGPAAPSPASTPGPFTYRRDRLTDNPTVQFELRLPEADLATIDRMVTEHGWSNRTSMLSAALTRHLERHGS